MLHVPAPKRRVCLDCGVKLFNRKRAKKHESKTKHSTGIDWVATEAHRKYLARQKVSYLDLLIAKDNALNEGDGSWN